MKKIDFSYEEKFELNYKSLIRETALIANNRNEYALINVKTGKLIMPWDRAEIKTSYYNGRFIREEEELEVLENGWNCHKYVSIFDANLNRMILDKWRIIRNNGSIAVLENPANGKRRFINTEFNTKDKLFKKEYANIEYLTYYDGDPLYAVDNGQKKAIYNERKGFTSKFVFDDITCKDDVIILKTQGVQFFRYRYTTSEFYDSIKYEHVDDDSGLIYCKRGSNIDVFRRYCSTCRKMFTVKADDMTLLNQSDEAALRQFPKEKYTQLLFGLTKNNKTYITRAVVENRGDAITPCEHIGQEGYDKVLEKNTKDNYVSIIEKNGKQGLFVDGYTPRIVKPKYERVVPLFDGLYCLGYKGDTCDIIEIGGTSTNVVAKNCTVEIYDKCAVFKNDKGMGIFDTQMFNDRIDGVKHIKDNFFLISYNGQNGLSYGSKLLTSCIYQDSHTAFKPDFKSETEYFQLLRYDEKYDVVKVNIEKNTAKAKRLYEYGALGVDFYNEFVLLECEDKTIIYAYGVGVIKTFRKGVHVSIDVIEDNRGKENYIMHADGLDYEYDSTNKKFKVVPMDRTVVFARAYEGEFGTYILTDTDKDTFDKYCNDIESMGDEAFEKQLRMAYIEHPDIMQKYPELKRKL